MAKIPLFTSSRAFTPATTGVRYDPAQSSQSGRAFKVVDEQNKREDFANKQRQRSSIIGSMQKAFGGLADQMQKKQSMQQDLVRKQYLIGNTTVLQQEAFDTYNKIKASTPSGVGLSEQFGQYYMERSQSILEQAPDERTGLVMQEKLAQLGFQYHQKSFQDEMQMGQTAAVNTVTTGIRSSINQALLSPEQFPQHQAQLLEYGKHLENYGVPGKQALSIIQRGNRDLAKSVVKGTILKDPEAALGQLTSGFYSDSLSGSDTFGLIGTAQSAIKKNQGILLKQLDEQILTTIGDGFASGQLAYDPDNPQHRKSLDSKFANFVGLISGASPEEMALQAQTKNSKDLVAGLLPQLGDADTVYKLSTEFISKHKGVPNSLKTTIQGNILNGTPERKALFSRVLSDIYKDDKTRPSVTRAFDRNIIEEALEMDESLIAGYGPEKAAELSRQISVPADTQTTKARRTTLKQSKVITTDKSMLAVSDALGFAGPIGESAHSLGLDVFRSADLDIPNLDIAAAEYSKAFENNFLKTGDLDRAESAATRQVQDKYEQIRINGRKEIQLRMPPHMKDTKFKFNYFTFLTTWNKKHGVKDGHKQTDIRRFATPDNTRSGLSMEEWMQVPVKPSNVRFTTRQPLMMYEGRFVDPRVELDERSRRDNSFGLSFYNEDGMKEIVLNDNGAPLRVLYNRGKTASELKVGKQVATLKDSRHKQNALFNETNKINRQKSTARLRPDTSTIDGESVLEQLGDWFSDIFTGEEDE